MPSVAYISEMSNNGFLMFKSRSLGMRYLYLRLPVW